MKVDTSRLKRLREGMKEAGLDALVCRLPENVVYMTDYWPHHGFSVAVLPKDGKPLPAYFKVIAKLQKSVLR